MTKKLLSVAALVALALPAAASAHATLKSEFPGFQQRLESGPKLVRLQFDQIVQLPVVEVLDAHGLNHAARAVVSGTEVRVEVASLPAGAYTIRWHVLSSDGHVVSGVWTFGVRVAAPPPRPTARAAPREPSTSCAGSTSWRSR
jgi:methionine-rich copper-binding protein CopC